MARAGRAAGSTCSWSAAASPAPAWPSTPPPAACAPGSSRPATSPAARRRGRASLFHGGLRYLEQARHRAGARGAARARA
nr:hypothetical protein [Angustibacter aerolatus]